MEMVAQQIVLWNLDGLANMVHLLYRTFALKNVVKVTLLIPEFLHALLHP